MNQLVNRHVLNERELRIVKSVDMLERRVVVDKMALKRRFHEPLSDGDAPGGDHAEIDGQRIRRLLTVELRADDCKVDEKPFFVLDDFRLRGDDAKIARVPRALVLNHNRQFKRFRRLDFLRPWVVPNDVALPEVVQFQFRLRIDGNRRRRHYNGDIATFDRIM